MTRKHIFVDIEYCPTTGQLIQIGACVNDSGKTFNRYVKPELPIPWDDKINGEDSDMTLGKLLPYGQAALDHVGVSEEQALTEWWQWVSEAQAGRRLVHWGGSDVYKLRQYSEANNVSYPKHETFDLKNAIKFMIGDALNIPKKTGQASTAKLMGINIDNIRQHDAFNDALILKHIWVEIARRLRLSGVVLDYLNK